MELILVRHGHTEANHKRVFQGWLDLSLSEKGRKQAIRLREELKNYQFEKIYVSPLKRALETAEIIKEGLKTPSEIVKAGALKEMNFGFWEGLSSDEIQARYPEDFQNWLKNWQRVRVPGGESAIQMFERVRNWVDKILKKHDEDTTLLIVSHEGVILQMIAYLLGFDLASSWHFRVDPGSLSVIEIIQGFSILIKLNHVVEV
ncbi:alpha-ribazole phosphatase [Anoxybacter fermentans]|uniref:Alpha-ribazole phosphatase n=1 Tax=Anoxybacter fermentans TaxID=1323375 RepID=A0A3Q9HT09_9FIRM|nr:alpha-ribazole phosphatase [Anoxybacter fermentans]AZR74646.1 alpha-ribazole phosphatase [Anoxybacter fermentans]